MDIQTLPLAKRDEPTELQAAREAMIALFNLTEREFIFSALEHLTRLLGVDCAVVAAIDEKSLDQAHTVAVVNRGVRAPNFSYALAGTPCANVVGQQACFYPGDVSRLFPSDTVLVELGAESYWGLPLRSARGDAIGVVAFIHSSPREATKDVTDLMALFAPRLGRGLISSEPKSG